MATRPQRIIRRRPEPVDEDELEELEEVQPVRKARKPVEPEPEDEYVDEDDGEEIYDEDVEEAPAPVRKAKPAPAPVAAKKPVPAKPIAKAVPARKPAAPPVDEDDGYEDAELVDDDQEEAPVVTKKAIPPAAKAVPAPAKPGGVISVKKVDTMVAGEILTELIAALEDSTKELVFAVAGEGKWTFTVREKREDKPKAAGKEYWDEVLSPEFLEWSAEWGKLTHEERKKRAVKAGAKWEPHKNPQVEIMRITEAYREAMGIEKYKPEYREKAARDKLRK